MDNCNNSKKGLSRSAGASLPSVNAAAFSNPAAIALSRGWGVESIHYQGEAQLGLVYGTGRIGGAIASNPNDGTFFGNVAVEDTNSFRLREIQNERFKEDKFVLAGATNLFGGKKKKGLSADLGVMWRRNQTAEEDNFGAGITLTFNKIISVGYARYRDLYFNDLRLQTGKVVDQFGETTDVIFSNDDSNKFEINYEVESFIYGVKFSNVAFDYVKFVTTFDNDTANSDTVIWNLSYFYTKWIFSYGRRHENSFKEVFDLEREEFVFEEDKNESFLGAQYATDNGFLLGAFINYYLQDELSLGVTYFF